MSTEVDHPDPTTGVHVSDNIWDDKGTSTNLASRHDFVHSIAPAILVRALSEYLRRIPGSSDIATYVRAFLTIQVRCDNDLPINQRLRLTLNESTMRW